MMNQYNPNTKFQYMEIPGSAKSERGEMYIASHNEKVNRIHEMLIANDYDGLISMVNITEHADGSKMDNKISISTSVKLNPFCQARRNMGDDCVCTHCFADSINEGRPTVKYACKRNTMILTNVVIPVENWKKLKLTPKLKRKAMTGFRIESLGDVANLTQALNYIHLVKAFPEIPFTAWSKNWKIWQQAFEIECKPENLIYIHSSSYVNKIDEPAYKFNNAYVDYVFTVYEREYAVNHPEFIYNCCTPDNKGRQCNRDCNDCYSKGNFRYRGEMLR